MVEANKIITAKVNQYMKDGTLLRQVINVVDELKLDSAKERNFFGETLADFACGTGGFLASTLNYLLRKENLSAEQREFYSNKAVFGIEKKPLPYLLAITNMLLHDLDTPNISHGNSLERPITEYSDDEKFPIVVMNPPYGGTELPIIRNNLPADLRGNGTADLFIALILYRLKFNGRIAFIISDGFLFVTDAQKIELKKRLFEQQWFGFIALTYPKVMSISSKTSRRCSQEHRDTLNSRINIRLEKISALLQNIGGDAV